MLTRCDRQAPIDTITMATSSSPADLEILCQTPTAIEEAVQAVEDSADDMLDTESMPLVFTPLQCHDTLVVAGTAFVTFVEARHTLSAIRYESILCECCFDKSPYCCRCCCNCIRLTACAEKPSFSVHKLTVLNCLDDCCMI